jgi:hypothetical protein
VTRDAEDMWRMHVRAVGGGKGGCMDCHISIFSYVIDLDHGWQMYFVIAWALILCKAGRLV